MEFNGGAFSPPAFNQVYGFPPPNPIPIVPELKKIEGLTRSEIVARAVGITIAIFLLLATAAAAAAAYCIYRKMKKRERRTQPPLPIQWPVLPPPLVESSAPLPPVVELRSHRKGLFILTRKSRPPPAASSSRSRSSRSPTATSRSTAAVSRSPRAAASRSPRAAASKRPRRGSLKATFTGYLEDNSSFHETEGFLESYFHWIFGGQQP